MTRRKNGEQHELTNTSRPSRLHREPEPSVAVPLMPSWLPEGRARQLWHKHAETLASLGLLSALDVESFGSWCGLQATAEAAIAEGRTPSRDILTAVRTLASRCGLDVESRTRILGKPPQAPRGRSEFDELDDM